MKTIVFSALLAVFMITGCKNSESELKEGAYRGTIYFTDVGETYQLPFNMRINAERKGAPEIVIINGTEEIKVEEVQITGDSLNFKMPVFMSQFKTRITKQGLTGEWTRLDRQENNRFPFRAKHGVEERFQSDGANVDISGNWKVTFRDAYGNEYPAIGEFEQNENTVTGTFMTETGDYRYLEGVVDKDSLKVSGFDGSHAYLFLAEVGENNMEGLFKGNHTHRETFVAERASGFHLEDPDSLTTLKKGTDKFTFAFPNLSGDTVSSSDPRYNNKVLIVQISGSWCSNCMDETRFLSELYEKYEPKGLEVVALCFERFGQFEKASQAIARVKKHFGANYPFLVAGTTERSSVQRALPMIKKLKSFPTTIFIDRTGKVRKIHTGFSGPGTSKYSEFVIATTAFVEELLAEEPS